MNRLLLHLGPPMRGLRAIVHNRPIMRMQVAFLLFNIAEPAMWIALLVYAFDQGGTRAVGFVSIICLVPAGLLAPVAAALGDRFRRERVVRLGYLVMALGTGIVAAALLLELPSSVVYVLAMLASIPYTVGRPNHHSLLPSLAEAPEEMAAANSISSFTEGIGYAIGAFTAGVLAAVGAGAVGAGAVYLVAAAALLLAMLCTLGVHAHRDERSPGVFHPWSLATDAIDGITTLARLPGPRLLVLIAGATAVATGGFGVLTVPLVVDRLGLGDPGLGFVNTLGSIGLFVGTALTVGLATRTRLAGPIIAGATLLLVGGLLFAGATATAAAVIASITFGVALTLLDVLGRTALQRVTDDEILTRVFGAVEAIWMLAYAGGAAIAPALEASIGLSSSFVAFGAVVPIAALVGIRGLRRVDEAGVVPERQLELLGQISIFAPLPRIDLERIARQMDLLSIPVGTDVIRQGDLGDRFYVVESGAFEILVDGRRIDTTGVGGFFGEIALIHDVPRTATVRAIESSEVWALDQEEFLATVTGLPQSRSAADEVSAERLRTHD
jgi:Na+/melibiose symporter-like transporter